MGSRWSPGGEAAAVQAPDLCHSGGAMRSACRRVHGGATRRAARLAARGGGHGEGSSGSSCHSASGLSSPAGQAAVACACAVVDLWVLLWPFPVRSEARLSRPCPRRVGVAAFDAHGGWGNRVGLMATEEVGARLVTQPVDPRS